MNHLRALFRKVASRSLFVTLVAFSACNSFTTAEEIKWVGYQFGPPGGFGINPFGDASFFHGDNWFNGWHPGKSPGQDGNPLNDVAVFDEGFDPQGNGMPFNVYFGDFTRPTLPDYPSHFIPGGDAKVERLVVRDGAFTFHFTDQFLNPQGGLSTTAQMLVGDVQGANASLTVKGGLLTTGAVAHIASGKHSNGRLIIDGDTTTWNHNSYVDLGWVGDGVIAVRSGATASIAGNVYAGIRDDSLGSIQVVSGGQLKAESRLLFGNGHEATGSARGSMYVSGIGSKIVASSIAFGGAGGTGAGMIRQGGSVEVSGAASLKSNALSTSGVLVTGTGSSLTVRRGMVIDANGKAASANVSDGAVASSETVFLNRNATSGIPATAELKVSDSGLYKVASDLTLYGQNGPTLVDARSAGRIEIGNVAQAASNGEIRIGAGGRLKGIGQIRGHVVVENGGVLEPGFSPGVLNIQGDVTFLPGSVTTLEIGGSDAGMFDQIRASGNVTLGGELLVRVLDGYVPPADSVLPLVLGGSFGATAFSSVTFQGIEPARVPPSWLDQSAFLAPIPIPEPATLLWALAAAYAGMTSHSHALGGRGPCRSGLRGAPNRPAGSSPHRRRARRATSSSTVSAATSR